MTIHNFARPQKITYLLDPASSLIERATRPKERHDDASTNAESADTWQRL
jgi:hypothetical protein